MPYIRFMTIAVISYLLPLFALGQAPAPQTPTPAEVQLDLATIKVRLMERIAAKVDQTVDMLNQKFKLEGTYYKDKEHKIRLQLMLKGLGDTGSTLLQVCDGKVLWDYQQVLKMQTYRKKDILPILQKLENPAIDVYFKSLVISQLGFGGPESMMTGLRRSAKFDQISEKKIDVDGKSIDVFEIGGTWIDRSKLLGMNDRPLPPTAPLPPYIPSNIRIFVGKEDGWPYKIEMIGNAPSLLQDETRAIDPVSGRPVGQPRKPPKVDPSKVTLFYTLLPVAEITPGLFSFQTPADISATNVKDDTEEFLAQIDALIQSEINRKKAEAAKAEGAPLLKASPLEVPFNPEAGGVGTNPTPESPTPK